MAHDSSYTGQDFKVVGNRFRRPDGVDKVTGKARYGADAFAPGQLVGKILRSPHAHAKIRKIDTSKAEKLPGVKAVITAADLPDLTGKNADLRGVLENCMARERALYDGHAVAAVAAVDEQTARKALKLIQVTYQVLPHVTDVDEAMKPDAPVIHDYIFTEGVEPKPSKPSNIAKRTEMGWGNVQAGFEQADVVIERSYRTEQTHQGYIEPNACLASVNPDGTAELWVTTQGPFAYRNVCAQLLGLDMAKLKVTSSEIGGGFGGKTHVWHEPLALALSRKANRPVKMVLTRDEVFRGTGPTASTSIDVKIGATSDGRIVAARAEMRYQGGAVSGHVGHARLHDRIRLLRPAEHAVHRLGRDRQPPQGGCVSRAVRADGRIRRGEHHGSGGQGDRHGPGRLPHQELRAGGHSGALRPEVRADRPRRHAGCGEEPSAHEGPLGRNQGRGVACGFWFNIGGQTCSDLNIGQDGTVNVSVGTVDVGGARASLAMIAAEELGVPYEQVRVNVADTASLGYNDTTEGSRGTFSSGMAVIFAAREAIEVLKDRAGKMWGIDSDKVVWENGTARAVGHEHDNLPPLSLAEIARKSHTTGGPIAGHNEVVADGAGVAFASHIVDVEVDPETGLSKILRYTVVQDAGKAIHPDYVEGQFQGAAAQGIGWALNEEYVYGKDGRLQNPGFLDYRIPGVLRPAVHRHQILEIPNPSHPYGIRGVGEASIVPPLGAIGNAIANAVGVRMTHAPMSPVRLLAALDEASESAVSAG
jgi:CO/xanthine dehydrogenase Mo-binding subunit